jgi:D-arabinose 1-dehydrogenase-like Zn-dependent alcohol dehydrogenase
VRPLTTAGPLHIPHSVFLVTPVLAWWHTPCPVAPVDPAEVARVFFLNLSILGSTMGTVGELGQLARFLVTSGVRPPIDEQYPLVEARSAFHRMAQGELFGKLVFDV